MRSYKIVASDLDGTLLNDKSKISNKNLFAVNELLKKEVYFVPSTGRTFSEMPEELKNNPAIRYIIYSNGAVVFDKQTGKSILNCIPNNVARDILDVLSSYETYITFRHNGECFADAAFKNEKAFDYYNVSEPHREVVRNYAICPDNFREISYSSDNVEVFSVFFHNYDDKLMCKKYLEKNDSLQVVEGFEYNIEIASKNAGKGNALRILADMLNVDLADTISIGDSGNDISIIEAAGLGLAVSNADDSLKSVADEIICSNEEHAVDYVLAHYFK